MKSEVDRIRELEGKPWLPRTIGYLGLMGPGYLQSAMTLGGGTAFASIFAGAAFGYRLLWVAPVAMLLGLIVLSAVAWQTLSTGQEPFAAMKKHAGGFFAYGWAISGILSSIIWQFAQYALASAMLAMIFRQLGWDAPTWIAGLIALSWCVLVAMLYGRARRLVRSYELLLTLMVWFIVACFAWVVIRTGIPHPEDLLEGIIPFNVPAESKGVTGLSLVVAGLAAAVGANMIFVYPYTLRRRQWGREHRRLARLDLGFGMLVPYVIAASLMLIASASIFHYQDPSLFTGKKISPVQAAEILATPERLGDVVGLWVFGLGIIAMALSSITMQMLCSGFALSVITNKPTEGWTYRIGMMLPAIGVLGAVFWSEVRLWMAVPTTIICGFLLPLVYVAFMIMQTRKGYLGEDQPRGALGAWWMIGMAVATLVLVVFLGWTAMTSLPGWIESIFPAPPTNPTT
ncbi:MAG: divalent metal cation transporter [Planctomycetota bacterium]|nr:divalent metal cation transporter [Planctomycetota bacterium]